MLGGGWERSGPRNGTDDWLINSHSFQQLSGRVKCLYLCTWLSPLFLHHNIWLKQSARVRALWSLATLLGDVQSAAWLIRAHATCKTQPTPTNVDKKWRESREYKLTSSAMSTCSTFLRGVGHLWTFTSCFRFKGHERGSESRTASPATPWSYCCLQQPCPFKEQLQTVINNKFPRLARSCCLFSATHLYPAQSLNPDPHDEMLFKVSSHIRRLQSRGIISTLPFLSEPLLRKVSYPLIWPSFPFFKGMQSYKISASVCVITAAYLTTRK